ncbi:hypothetical protein [Chamaesiphon sp. OTE_75_metabat_556]|jgi:hypothetical protein|uniref:hypothetical protein n=1 Tax=Chamaesiphon sp. OTE_75_metabat_556 TaxID=2964692 RepID=UPI00286A7041|nr:hypothetical protein [Chamaesiphon sp. OTE_75_metabat_556]
MAYIDRPNDYIGERTLPVVAANYHDQVRWGPIVAGLVVALSTQLVLSALGVAVGAGAIGDSGAPRTDAGGVGVNIGIWSIVSLLISLFAGGWTAARTAGRMSRNTALLNGAILWASMLALSAWLLSSGVSGAFGVAASNAGGVINQVRQVNPSVVPTTPGQVAAKTPNITAQQTREIAENTSKVSWSFVFGSLLGLVSSLIGSAVGHRNPRLNTLPERE